MRFGSVEFFKVLIKTALTILFFVPLILAVVFGVLFVTKNAELKEAQKQNTALQTVADVLVAEKAGTAKDFYEIFSMSGVSYAEFIEMVNRNGKLDAQGFYRILSEAGVSDANIIALAASGKNIACSEFYKIMTDNGITDKDLMTAVLNNAASAEKLYELLKQCGMSDKDIAELSGLAGSGDIASSASSGTQSSGQPASSSSDKPADTPPSSDSPYAALYPDMYVTAPTTYFREKGTVYLTFDDGPNENTADKLYILRSRGVKATFFVVPDRSAACTQRLKAIVADGHAIGVHSTSHEYKEIYASVEAFLKDFYEAWDTIYDATGVKTEIFRFPGGSKNDYNEATRDAIIEEMTRRGFRYYDWNVDSGDAAGANWTQMHNSIPRDIKDKYRSVVLMHDRTNATLVLDDVISVLLSEGYKLDKINNDTQPVQFIGPFA
ncbi:MAG: polysaccharide deacetylase family protein [Oscillospiraceae bacterium]